MTGVNEFGQLSLLDNHYIYKLIIGNSGWKRKNRQIWPNKFSKKSLQLIFQKNMVKLYVRTGHVPLSLKPEAVE